MRLLELHLGIKRRWRPVVLRRPRLRACVVLVDVVRPGDVLGRDGRAVGAGRRVVAARAATGACGGACAGVGDVGDGLGARGGVVRALSAVLSAGGGTGVRAAWVLPVLVLEDVFLFLFLL